MSEAHRNARLICEFHDAQNRFYAGGDQEHVRAMLSEDVAWHVPGRSAIAGDYRGRDEVLRYFVAISDYVEPVVREGRDRVITGIVTAVPILSLFFVGWQLWARLLG